MGSGSPSWTAFPESPFTSTSSRAAQGTADGEGEGPGFADLLAIAVALAAAWALFASPVDAQPWIKLVLIGSSGVLSRLLLRRVLIVTRVLRYITVAAILVGTLLLVVSLFMDPGA